MPRALLLTLLSQQWLRHTADGFRNRYPHAWLVWEAGAWSVPQPGEDLFVTRFPHREVRDCLPFSDVVCFALTRNGEQPLKLGRSPDNTIVVSDSTVSREHLLLQPLEEDGWAVELVEGASEAKVGEIPLTPGEPKPLEDGAQLELGGVQFTYYSSDGFLARLRRHKAVKDLV
jgi:hypothetical protein